MRKRIVRPSLLFPLVLLWVTSSLISAFQTAPRAFPLGIAWAQEEEKEPQDSHYVQLMKQLKIKVDGWLKEINERIESEEVTRFEVRFLEILRSLLEWIGEKIEGQIESGKKKAPKKMKGEDV
ncbi:MAG: hypothetical protein N3G78_00950 [Desulfobacterota bacterium]|nr:hypothetical protein [Thermodesulfobacteriota bacterium]